MSSLDHEQRTIIRDCNIAARMQDMQTDDRWKRHWSLVKCELIHDYERVSKIITWPRGKQS